MPLPSILQEIEEEFAVFFDCPEEQWFELLEYGQFKIAWNESREKGQQYINNDYPI